MNRQLVFVLAILCLTGIPMPELAGQEAVDPGKEAMRAGQQVAATMTAREAIASFAKRETPGLVDEWVEIMLDQQQLPRHQKTDDSQKILRRTFAEHQQRALGEELQRIQLSFNTGGEAWFSERWLLDYVAQNFADEQEESLKTNATTYFLPTFKTARTVAVARQIDELQLDAHPSPEEVEALVRSSLARSELENRLVMRMRGDALLLDGTKDQLGEVATGTVDDARAQYEAQRSALDLPVPDGLRTRAAISRALEEHVQDARQQHRQRHGAKHPLYEIFPSIAARLRERSVAMEVERFKSFLEAFGFPIDEQEISALIARDTARHRSTEGSQTLLLAALFERASEQVVAGYASQVGDASENAAFRAVLQSLLTYDEEVHGALEGNLERDLEPLLERVRAQLAKGQLAKISPPLSTKSWQAPESLLLQIEKEGLPCDVSDFAGALDLPRARAGGERFERTSLLIETETETVTRADRLLKEGCRAWRGQLNIVDHYESRFPELIGQEPKCRTVAGCQTYFLAETTTKWRRERPGRIWDAAGSIPEHGSSKYRELFAHVRESLTKRIESYFEKATALPPPPPPQPPSPLPSPQKDSEGFLQAMGRFLKGLFGGGEKDGGGRGRGTGDGKGDNNNPHSGGDCGEPSRCVPLWILLMLLPLFGWLWWWGYRRGRPRATVPPS